MWINKHGLSYSATRHLVRRPDYCQDRVRLAKMEYRLFLALLAAYDDMTTREELINALWLNVEEAEPSWPDNNLKQYTHRLRKKLKPLGVSILTHYRRGMSLAILDPERGGLVTADAEKIGYRENVA